MMLTQENSFFTERLLPTQHDAVAPRWIAGAAPPERGSR
jgi:hypothetical protein